MNLPLSAATNALMKQLNVPATREIDGVFDWILANLDRLLIGGIVAAAIVAVMLAMRWIGHRLLANEPQEWGWRGIIGRVRVSASRASSGTLTQRNAASRAAIS